MRFRRLGFRGVVVPVQSTQTEVNASLVRDVLQLEEQVVTGEATTVARQNLANDVASVNADELNRAPAPTIEYALQGKIAGATISANSGAPGGGVQVQLRGVTTINASIDPLYVIDGVVISNEAIAPGTNAVTAASAGGNASMQDNPVNRTADLNPADIERIEVLKGASASAIYGSKAANGVIIITTKRGVAGREGRPQLNVTQRVGTFQLSNKVGSRNWTLDDALNELVGVAGDSAAIRAYFDRGKVDYEEELWGETDLSYETNLSARGVSGSTQYFLSGLIKRDAGIMRGTGYNKRSARVNITQSVGSRLTLNLATNYVSSLAQRGITNNDNAGVSYYMVLPFTPDFVNLLPQNGVYPEHPIERSNVLQTRDLTRNDETVNRFIGGGNAKYDLINTERQSLSFNVNGGIDQFSQRNAVYSPPELFFEDDDQFPGTAVRGNHNNVNLNFNFSAQHSFFPAARGFSATTTAGVQRSQVKFNSANTVTRDLVSGQENVNQGARVEVFERRELVKDFAYFLQEQVLALDERLFVSAGVRAERNSNNGDKDKYWLFPKAAASYRIPLGGTFLDELKLRAAVGQTGNPPLYGQKFTAFLTEVYDGRVATRTGLVKGKPDIEPERQTEVEGGVDATLFDERVSLAATVYQKTVKNLILQRTLAMSTGFQTEILQGAAPEQPGSEDRDAGTELRNRGVEILLAAVPYRSTGFNWVSRVTFARNTSEVTKLSVPTFQVGGFGTSLGAFQIEKGKSATQIVGLDGTNVVVVGDAAPDFQMGFSNELTWNRLRLSSLFDWRKGGHVINLTKFLYDLLGNSVDFGGPDSPGAIRLSRLGSKTSDFVEDAGFVKLRELTLSYELPESLTGRVLGGAARTARLELSGRNLYTWTDYSGADPEVSNFGNQSIVRNIDVAPYPPSRSYFFTVSVDF